MLSISNKPFMLSVIIIMLRVIIAECHYSEYAIVLSVTILNSECHLC
jgi:hypothetical protein